MPNIGNDETNHPPRLRRMGMLLALALLGMIAQACSTPGGEAPTATPALTEVAAASPTPPEAGEAPAAEKVDETAKLGQTPTPQTVTPRVRITANIAVRSGPSPNCPLIGSFTTGEEVGVEARSLDDGWWKVPFGGGSGWVSASYTAPIDDVGDVPTDPASACAPPPTAPPATAPPTTVITATAPATTPTPPGLTMTPGLTVTVGGITPLAPVTLSVCDINPKLCVGGALLVTIDPCILNPDAPGCGPLDPGLVLTFDVCAVNPELCAVEDQPLVTIDACALNPALEGC